MRTRLKRSLSHAKNRRGRQQPDVLADSGRGKGAAHACGGAEAYRPDRFCPSPRLARGQGCHRGSRSCATLRKGQFAGSRSVGKSAWAERKTAGGRAGIAKAPVQAVMAWHEEPIKKKHDREAFDCGEQALNEFLRRHARQSHERGGAKTFLAIDDADNKTILGFYSLSPASVEYARTPETVRRGLARHDVPGFRLARLAVHRRLQGQGLEIGRAS